MTSNKSNWILVSVIIAVIAITAGVVLMVSRGNKPPQPVAEPHGPVLSLESLKPGAAAALLPVGFPLEPGEVIQSSEVTDSSTKRKQITFEFVTANSSDKNITLYQKYFTNAKWTLAPVMSLDSNTKTLSAKQGDKWFIIQIGPNAALKKNTVKISYTLPA